MMRTQLRIISDEDWSVLKQLIAQNKNLIQNIGNRPSTNNQYQDGDDSMSPEVYIALPPTDGIPALTSEYPGSSSDNPPAEGDRPGSAVCDVYRISSGELKPVSGLTRVVNNLSETEIDQDWLLIERDKFGSWIPVVSSGGSSRNIKRGKLAAELSSGSRVSPTDSLIDVWAFDGIDWSDANQQLVVHDDGMIGDGNSPLPMGTWIQIVKIGSYWFYDGHNCDPSTGTAS